MAKIPGFIRKTPTRKLPLCDKKSGRFLPNTAPFYKNWAAFRDYSGWGSAGELQESSRRLPALWWWAEPCGEHGSSSSQRKQRGEPSSGRGERGSPEGAQPVGMGTVNNKLSWWGLVRNLMRGNKKQWLMRNTRIWKSLEQAYVVWSMPSTRPSAIQCISIACSVKTGEAGHWEEGCLVTFSRLLSLQKREEGYVFPERNSACWPAVRSSRGQSRLVGEGGIQ